MDAGGFSVHRNPGTNDCPPVSSPDALVAQADPENGDTRAHLADDLGGNPRLTRGARTRRDDDVRRPQLEYLIHRYSVVAPHYRLLAQLMYVAGEVVDERVVVVDQENHGL